MEIHRGKKKKRKYGIHFSEAAELEDDKVKGGH